MRNCQAIFKVRSFCAHHEVSRGSNLPTPSQLLLSIFFIILVWIGAFWFGFCISLITDVDHLFMCLSTVYLWRNVFVHHLPVFKLGYIFLLLSCNESLIFDLLKMENVEKCVCFQDKVLHNIMSIFTFMGANVMRLDDTYSFQVINKTVKMVIPALIQVSFLLSLGLYFIIFKILHGVRFK